MKVCCRVVSAQAILASLFARAQVTTKLLLRHRSSLTQSASLPSWCSNCCIKTLAHWTSRIRTFLLPRLLIPSNVVRPPVLCWRDTSPVAAAKSRLLAYCFPSPNAVEIVLAVRVPTQGILSKRCPTSS